MKTFLFSLLAFLACTTAQAQLQKGRMYLGGSMQFIRNTTNPTNPTKFGTVDTRFNISPTFGYFISDKWTLGANLGYTNMRSIANNPSSPRKDNISVGDAFKFGIHSRFYAKSFADNFKFFLNFGVGTEIEKTRGWDYRTQSLFASISPNFAYFLNNKWCLELGFTGLQYNQYRIKVLSSNVYVDGYETSHFIFGTQSFNPSLGVTYFIR